MLTDAIMELPKRDSTGKFPALAWPGGYQIYYLDGEGNELCANCATKSADDVGEVPQFKPVSCDIHYEGESIYCTQCGTEIESAYGVVI